MCGYTTFRFRRPDIVEPDRYLAVLKTIERVGGSASYEKHLSKPTNSSALSVPDFPNHDPVYAQIKVTRLLGSTKGLAKVQLMSGGMGEFVTTLEFWVDQAAGESTAGGVFGYMDWEFLKTHEINFAVHGAEHFDAATITFSHEIGIIGQINLLGSWSLAAVKDAYGTCQWKWVCLAIVYSSILIKHYPGMSC